MTRGHSHKRLFRGILSSTPFLSFDERDLKPHTTKANAESKATAAGHLKIIYLAMKEMHALNHEASPALYR